MASARPLRDVFADLVGAPSAADDPAAFLRDHGHSGLPDDLVAEAVVSYADTAPVEVAEHLAPYVTAHSAAGDEPVGGDEPAAGWLDLLGTAPDVSADEPADLDGPAPAPGGSDTTVDVDPDLTLDFGTGAGPDAATQPDDGFEDGGQHGLVEILADPAELDERDDAAGWVPTEQDTDLTADLTAEESDGDDGDDGEPDGEQLG
jgi:hypothetical protein